MASKIQADYDMGLIGEDDRYRELVDIWRECTRKVADAMLLSFLSEILFSVW